MLDLKMPNSTYPITRFEICALLKTFDWHQTHQNINVWRQYFASKMEKMAGAIIVFFNKESIEILKIPKNQSNTLGMCHNPDIRYGIVIVSSHGLFFLLVWFWVCCFMDVHEWLVVDIIIIFRHIIHVATWKKEEGPSFKEVVSRYVLVLIVCSAPTTCTHYLYIPPTPMKLYLSSWWMLFQLEFVLPFGGMLTLSLPIKLY